MTCDRCGHRLVANEPIMLRVGRDEILKRLAVAEYRLEAVRRSRSREKVEAAWDEYHAAVEAARPVWSSTEPPA